MDSRQWTGHSSSAVHCPPSTALNGWIILDKPSGITSAHAVAKVKRLLGRPKIGHAGTLDPLASGILPLAIGEATKTVAYMMDGRKSYGFTVTWGEERDTDDSQGQVTQTSEKRPTLAEINALLPEFTGAIQQTPPNYSAIKVDGKRAYDMARAGEIGKVAAREVVVDRFQVSGLRFEPLSETSNLEHETSSSFEVDCGKGTYIRSLARDMGRKLGCLGYISQLRRLRVANFTEEHAISLEMLEKMFHKGELSFLRPVESALDDILAWDISPDQAIRIKRGQTIELAQSTPENTELLLRCEGKLVAMGKVSQGSVKPARVFNL